MEYAQDGDTEPSSSPTCPSSDEWQHANKVSRPGTTRGHESSVIQIGGLRRADSETSSTRISRDERELWACN